MVESTITTATTGTSTIYNGATTATIETPPTTTGAPPTVDYEKKAKELEASMNALKAEMENLKRANDKASSEAAEWKRQYRSTLDEAARKEAETSDALSEMKAQLETYKVNERVASYTNKLIEAGYDPETAKSMAPVLPENLDDSFFSTQKSFLESQKLKFKTESLNSQPGLSSGMPMSGKTAEQMENDKLRQWMGLPTK